MGNLAKSSSYKGCLKQHGRLRSGEKKHSENLRLDDELNKSFL